MMRAMQDRRPDRSHIEPVGESGWVCFDIISPSAPGDGIALDTWYVNHHLKTRAADRSDPSRCYVAPASASYLQLTETDRLASQAAGNDPPGGRTPGNLRERLCFLGRSLGTWRRRDRDRSIDAPILYPIFFSVPAEAESEFDCWYDEEHVPMLLNHPDWGMCRRFALQGSRPEGAGIEPRQDVPGMGALRWNRVALHYLSDLRALESAERDAARSTPWRLRLQAQAWFNYVGRIYYRAGIAAATGSQGPA